MKPCSTSNSPSIRPVAFCWASARPNCSVDKTPSRTSASPTGPSGLTHTVRQVADLNYRQMFETDLPIDPDLGELVGPKLRYYPTVTRESYRNMGRITELLHNGKLFTDLDLPEFDPAIDRVMLCGSPGMLVDLKHMLEARGFNEGNTSTPGHFVVERAFAEK